MEEKNKILNLDVKVNKNYMKNIITEKSILENDNIKEKLIKMKYYYYKFNKIQLINYFIIYILLFKLYFINSLIYLNLKNALKNIAYFSYEITLKVKNTGLNNILGSSSSNGNHIYPYPSNIYINDELVQDYTDCHFINIIEPESNIKLEWIETTIISTNSMFYGCTEITEIDMTNFDNSLVTDMSEMFSMCSSLKSLNVSNLDTKKVQLFRYMFYNCISLTSLNLESFTNPSASSLYRMFYGCKYLQYLNIKNFEEKQSIIIVLLFSPSLYLFY